MTSVTKNSSELTLDLNVQDLRFKVNSLVETTGCIPVEISGKRVSFLLKNATLLSYLKDEKDVTIAFIFSLSINKRKVILMFEGIHQILIEELGKSKPKTKPSWPKKVTFKMWT